MVSTVRKTIAINDDIGIISVKQNEHLSRKVELTLMDVDESEPIRVSGCDVRVYVEMYSKGKVFFDGTVTDGDNGVVSFLIPNSVTQYPGSYKAEVWIFDPENDSQLATLYFTIEVGECLRDDSAIETTEECNTFISALNRLGRVESKVEQVEKQSAELIDGELYAKPIFLSEVTGYSAQSMTIAGQSETGNYYLIGFSKDSDTSKSLLMIFDSGTQTVLSSREYPFGHVNSMGVNSEGMVFIPNGNTIVRFMVESYEDMLITQDTSLAVPEGWSVDGVFGHNGTVYAYGTHDDSLCYWRLESWDGEVEIQLPDEQPRVSQGWGTDGRFLYILKSNPNTAAVYDFESGEFIRWVHIGDFIGDTYTLGEIETVCFTEGVLKLLSQYFYPESNKTKRFWVISDLKYSCDLPYEQQHSYPNEERKLYVSNSLKGSMVFRTNNGDLYPKTENQTGSKDYPFPSIETALYAAMATPRNPAYIVVKNTETDYVVENLELNLPMSLTIECSGTVIFKRLELKSGTLTIIGDSEFRELITAQGTKLSVNGGTFTATSRIADRESTRAPYILDGNIGIINSKYTGESDEILIEFQSGVTGVMGFTQGSPCSSNFQQINLVLYNIRNAGRRHRWINLCTVAQQPTIGSAVPTVFNIIDNTEYRIKWRASSSNPWQTTVAHISGETTVELLTILSGSTTLFRKVYLLFKPVPNLNGTVTISGYDNYNLGSSGLTIDSHTSGSLPSGWQIASIDVLGF